MTGETELLLSKIKGEDIIAYYQMQYLNNTNSYGPKEAKMSIALEHRLYNLFLKSIDKDSASRLKALDALIEETKESITDGNDWHVNSSEAEMRDNYQNWDDFEFRTCSTHTIKRNGAGYYIERNFQNIIDSVSYNFLISHKKQFEDLHGLYSEKESIMRGHYSLRDDVSDYDLPVLISSYLGYYREQTVRKALAV